MLKTLIAACAALLAVTGSATAQTYPSRPITMVIPFAAGGPTDIVGRVMAQRMGEILGQQIVIENVAGAGGMTGGQRVAQAQPDGYTIGLGTVGTHAQGQTLYKKPLYDAVADFTPVALVADVPLVLLTRKDLPAASLQDFIAYTKANQAKMSYGSAGTGSGGHLACVLLDSAMGTKVTHVPYRGTTPGLQDLMAGRIDFYCDVLSTALPHIQGGTLKALAIMTKERSPVLPDLPSAHEQGLRDFEAYTWNAIFLPKGAPDEVVKRLNAAARDAMKTPAVRERLQGLGAQIVAEDRATPQYLGQFVKSEIAKWAAPIRAAGVSAE